MDNVALARAFDELADLLELAGENPFKTRAYRTFAQSVRELGEPMSAVVSRGELEAFPGVGKAIAAKVTELLATGTCGALERVRAQVPRGLLDVLRVPGLGVKTVRMLWTEAGITSLGELASACEADAIASLPRFGKKKQAGILSAVVKLLDRSDAMLLSAARKAGATIKGSLGSYEVCAVGEARRGAEVVRDLLVLARAQPADGDPLRALEALGTVEDDGPGSAVVRLREGGRARVRVVPSEQWVASLLMETGSAEHVRWLAEKAGGNEKLLALAARSADEAEVYRELGLPFVPPELRDRPAPIVPEKLLEERDLGGVFHVHTDWSDGEAPLLEMVRAAEGAGLAFVGISDHSQAANYANGLTAERLRAQTELVLRAREEVAGIEVLHGVEVDILEDGSLDLDDETLSALDFVIASVHTGLTMEPARLTARIVRAVSHPLVTMLGHPTGRLLLARRGAQFDLKEVATAAAANDTYLEINANAQRLDLSDSLVREAAAQGARFVINPDAHATRAFEDTPLGVTIARRAGLEPANVLNACGREEIVRRLRGRKKSALAKLR